MIEAAILRSASDRLAAAASACRSNYERCRPDVDFSEWMYRTVLTSLGAFILVAACSAAYLLAVQGAGLSALALAPASGLAAAFFVYYARSYSVKSRKDYRGALIDASLVHVVGFMLTMAESNVPLNKMFSNISNLGSVYGEDIAIEAAYILSLVEEDGMDVVSALRAAQSASPSVAWQELLIGIAEVYGSGGSLKEYLKGKYQALTDRKRLDVKRYNDSIQGLSSIYLSIVGIASMFISLINLVFNMAGWLSGDTLVWLDAVVIVPLGSLIVVYIMKASDPEA